MYEDILRLFNKNRVKYVIVGGIAVNLQGAMRSTADLDIATELTLRNLSGASKTCTGLGYKLRQPIQLDDICDPARRKKLIKDKHLKAITFYKPGGYKEIDILIDLPVPFAKLYSNADLCKIGSFRVRLANIDDLIKIKSISSRALDKTDIQILKEIKKIRGKSKTA